MCGSINQIEWTKGEYPPKYGWGIASEYGYFYQGQRYIGLGVGRTLHADDRIRFHLDLKHQICRGDINNHKLRRVFCRGNQLPNKATIAILVLTGEGEFQVLDNRPKLPWN